MSGVSVVIPIRNGARWLDSVLTAVRRQAWSGPIEIIAVDDGSTDGSADVLSKHAAAGDLRIIQGDGLGAAAALNRGVRAASYSLIAQVDQDVIIEPEWLARLAAELEDPQVGAAQGHYVSDDESDIWSRVMALDLALRYHRLDGTTNHVCTGNTVYRRAALLAVGLFDETLGYGYDNDMSYRLTAAGYRLAFRSDARSVHYWRPGAMGYALQQYGFGYGRLNVLRKHPRRAAGDDVSRLGMMLQGPATAAALAAAAAAMIANAARSSSLFLTGTAAVLAATLAAERFLAGLGAAIRFRDAAGLWFVPVHAVRNLAWVAAMLVWAGRTLIGLPSRSIHSMRPRPGGSGL